MNRRSQKSVNETKLHRVIAMLFLVLLFVEWGSHGLAFSHAYSPDGQAQAVGTGEPGHDDPCRTMIRGTDAGRQDRPVPTVGHDITQANTYFYMPDRAYVADPESDPRLSRPAVIALFQPGSPPFHPPEIS